MADFSKIRDPSGTVRNVKDSTARSSISSLESTVTTLSKKIDSIPTSDTLAALTTRVDNLEKDVNDLESDVSTLSTTVSGHTTSISNLQSTTSGLSSTVSTLDSSVSTLQSDMTAVKSEISTIEVGGIEQITVTKTIAVADWSTSGTYSLESTYPTAKYDVFIDLNGDSATSTQFDAWMEAKVVGSNTSNQIKYLGTKPTVAIPILVKVVSK